MPKSNSSSCDNFSVIKHVSHTYTSQLKKTILGNELSIYNTKKKKHCLNDNKVNTWQLVNVSCIQSLFSHQNI